jgi:hypothetical protein
MNILMHELDVWIAFAYHHPQVNSDWYLIGVGVDRDLRRDTTLRLNWHFEDFCGFAWKEA